MITKLTNTRTISPITILYHKYYSPTCTKSALQPPTKRARARCENEATQPAQKARGPQPTSNKRIERPSSHQQRGGIPFRCRRRIGRPPTAQRLGGRCDKT